MATLWRVTTPSPAPHTPIWRRVAAAAFAALPAVLMLWPGLAVRDALGPEIVSVLGSDGWEATGRSWTLAAAIAGGCAVAGIAVAGLVRRDRTRLMLMCDVALVAGLCVGLWFAQAIATLQRGDDAESLSGWAGLAAALAGLMWMGLMVLVHGGAPREQVATSAPQRGPMAAGAAGPTGPSTAGPSYGGAAWPVETRARSRLYGVASWALGITGFVTGVPILAIGETLPGVLILVLLWGLAAWLRLLTRVRVRVDDRGLTVRSVLGPMLKQIPLARIRSVHLINLVPKEWGAGNLRWQAGRSAWISHAGPALAVVRTDGREYAVTLADPRELGEALVRYLAILR